MSAVRFGPVAPPPRASFSLRRGGPRSPRWIVAAPLDAKGAEVVFEVTFPDDYPARPPCARLPSGGAFSFCPPETPATFAAFVQQAVRAYAARRGGEV